MFSSLLCSLATSSFPKYAALLILTGLETNLSIVNFLAETISTDVLLFLECTVYILCRGNYKDYMGTSSSSAKEFIGDSIGVALGERVIKIGDPADS